MNHHYELTCVTQVNVYLKDHNLNKFYSSFIHEFYSTSCSSSDGLKDRWLSPSCCWCRCVGSDSKDQCDDAGDTSELCAVETASDIFKMKTRFLGIIRKGETINAADKMKVSKIIINDTRWKFILFVCVRLKYVCVDTAGEMVTVIRNWDVVWLTTKCWL